MAEVMQDNWIKARDVYAALKAGGMLPADATETLANLLRDGDVSSRARCVWISEQPELSKAWQEDPKIDDLQVLPTRYWRSNKNVLEDRALWRLIASRLHSTIRKKPIKRRMMRGVEFNVKDLQKTLPSYFAPSPKKKNRGRPVEIDKRDQAWSLLLHWMFENLSIDGKLPDITELINTIICDRDDRGLENKTGQNQISDVVRGHYDYIKDRLAK